MSPTSPPQSPRPYPIRAITLRGIRASSAFYDDEARDSEEKDECYGNQKVQRCETSGFGGFGTHFRELRAETWEMLAYQKFQRGMG